MEAPSPRGFLFRKPSATAETAQSEGQRIGSMETLESDGGYMAKSPRTTLNPITYDQSPKNSIQSSADTVQTRMKTWGSWQPNAAEDRRTSFDDRRAFAGSADPAWMAASPPRMNGLQARDASADVLVLRLHSMTNIAPLRTPLSYVIVPCVERIDKPGEAIAGPPIGRFRADPDLMSPGCVAVQINSDVLRFHAAPKSMFYFKIQEDSTDNRSDMFGMVTLSGLPEQILADPTVLPEQVINRPEFRMMYCIDSMDGNVRGEMTLSVLFDYSRPGEYPWPHPQNQALRLQQQSRLRSVAAAGSGPKGYSPLEFGAGPPLPVMLQHPRRRQRSHESESNFITDLKAFCMTLPDTFC